MGDLDMVRILLREGQEINEQSQFKKNTALHLAAANGHILIVKYLVQEKADAAIKNLDDKMALQLAQEALKKVTDEGDGKPPVKGSEEDRLRVIINFLSEKVK